ncbi:4820_t:CDS:10 [Rhizophagus irregularis]|nr:4820_t:CDS:10 [Rhizophagus irregularis]
MEESNQNLLRRSSVSSSASTSSIESRTSLNQPKPEVTSIQASSQLESRTSTVAKPQGSTAKNICKVLNLQKSDYQGYRGDLRDLIKAGSLELDKKWKDQDMKRILNLIKLVEAEKNNSEKQKEQDNEVQEEQDNEVHEEPDNEVLTNTNIIEEHSQYKENQEPFGDNSNQASNKKKGKKKLKRAIGSNLKDDHANKKQKNDQRRSRRLATSVGEEEECKYKGKPPVPPWMNDQEYQLFLEKRLKNESQQIKVGVFGPVFYSGGEYIGTLLRILGMSLNANFSFEFSGIRELQDLLETLQNFFFEPSELSEWFRTFILPKNTFKDTLKLNTFSSSDLKETSSSNSLGYEFRLG